MSDIKISALPLIQTVNDDDILIINDFSAAETKRVSVGTLLSDIAKNIRDSGDGGVVIPSGDLTVTNEIIAGGDVSTFGAVKFGSLVDIVSGVTAFSLTDSENGMLFDDALPTAKAARSYTPSTSTNWINVPSTIKEALDELAQNGISGGSNTSPNSFDSVTVDSFSGNGNATTFSLTSNISDPEMLFVFIDGLVQKVSGYSVSGNFLVFSTSPPLGSDIEVRYYSNSSNFSLFNVEEFSGDGSTTAYTMSYSLSDPEMTYVSVDGLLQAVSNYSVSGTTLTFSTAPPIGSEIEVRSFSVDSTFFVFDDESFLGDGSTTAYTMNKSITQPGLLHVSVDGLIQTVNSYASSGLSLIFSSAPPIGSNIEIRKFIILTPTSGVDEFNGDGSTTSFSLTSEAVTNDTIVHINGVYQYKSTYSISGNTLTFNTAPLNNSAIEVVNQKG